MAPLNYPKGMFAGKTAIITGSGQGIGAETARLFANEGANVVVTDINAGKLVVRQLLRILGRRCGFILLSNRVFGFIFIITFKFD